MCTSCIICYASQIVEILHFLQLFLIYLICTGNASLKMEDIDMIKYRIGKELDISE